MSNKTEKASMTILFFDAKIHEKLQLAKELLELLRNLDFETENGDPLFSLEELHTWAFRSEFVSVCEKESVADANEVFWALHRLLSEVLENSESISKRLEQTIELIDKLIRLIPVENPDSLIDLEVSKN